MCPATASSGENSHRVEVDNETGRRIHADTAAIRICFQDNLVDARGQSDDTEAERTISERVKQVDAVGARGRLIGCPVHRDFPAAPVWPNTRIQDQASAVDVESDGRVIS